MKKIYYSAAVQGVKHADPNFGWNLVQFMKDLGFDVISEHVAERTLQENNILFTKNTGIDLTAVKNPMQVKQKANLKMVDTADYMVCIIDGPSHGVGMEIMRGLLKPKIGLNTTQILCLVHEDNLDKVTIMLRGISKEEFPNFSISTYADLISAKNIVKEFLSDPTN